MGTKIGCREGDCGACTVLVGSVKNQELRYQSMTSCLMPLANAQGKHIVTIEGINLENELNPIQQAMAEEGATQCGFCTPGFVVSLAGYCLNGDPSKEHAIAAIDGNICRCTGYKSILRAGEKITGLLEENKNGDPIKFVTGKKILPAYFTSIKRRLETLNSHAGFTIHDSGFTIRDSRLTTVGGGTDLYVQKHEEMVHAENQYLFDEPVMKQIVQEDDRCVMGGNVTVTDLLDSSLINKIFPDFRKYAKLVSSTPIRNMATIAGNFVNASPIGDFSIFFLALDANIDLTPFPSAKEGSKRALPLRKLYKGYKQLDKQPNEIVESIWFRIPPSDHYFNFEKVSKRTHLDIASVNTAIYLELRGKEIVQARISAGGVAPIPLFMEKTSAFLKGKKISDSLVMETVEVARAEITPISDARGSKEYKTFLLGQLIRAHFGEMRNKK